MAMFFLFLQAIYLIVFSTSTSELVGLSKIILIYITVFFIFACRIFENIVVLRQMSVILFALNILFVGGVDILALGWFNILNGFVGICLSVYVFFKRNDAIVDKTNCRNFLFDVPFVFLISYFFWNLCFIMRFFDGYFLFYSVLNLFLPIVHSVVLQNNKIFLQNRGTMLCVSILVAALSVRFDFLKNYLLIDAALYLKSIPNLHQILIILSFFVFSAFVLLSCHRRLSAK